MAGVEQKTIAQDENLMRLDRWFKLHYAGLGFAALQKLLRSGQIRVDGKRAKADTRLQTGQIVRVPPLAIASISGAVINHTGLKNLQDSDALTKMLLYQDDNIFILNKPAGLAVQGGSGIVRHIDGMLESWRNKKGEKPRLVHRIDRDTSGLLLIAKRRSVAQFLAEGFKKRNINKSYWALVRGVPRKREDRISSWLCREKHPGGDIMKVCQHGNPDAVHAISTYKVIEIAARNIAWLEMHPLTGRTHQLRVHAAQIGHPIIGDPKYFFAEPSWDFPGGIQNRLHLHARGLHIPDYYGKSLEITAPLPPHMQQSFNLLGFDSNL